MSRVGLIPKAVADKRCTNGKAVIDRSVHVMGCSAEWLQSQVELAANLAATEARYTSQVITPMKQKQRFGINIRFGPPERAGAACSRKDFQSPELQGCDAKLKR